MLYRLLVILLMFPLLGTSQEMQRRSFLGVQLEPMTADVRRIMALPGITGVLVSAVVPKSTAEAAGFKKGDVLIAIDGREVNDPAEVVTYIAEKRGTREFTYKLVRGKKKISGKAKLLPYPQEVYRDMDVLYTQVTSATGQNRLIITKPKQDDVHPAVVFIGGYGCYSLDLPMDTNRSELQLLRALTRAGYMTVRIEKPGMGDSKGVSKDCHEIGFHEEAGVYLTAVNELKKRKDIDPEHIYLLGHSMGGVMAPLVAAQTSVKGVIAYGTIGSNFMEYLAKTRRTIAAAYQMEPDTTDAYVKESCDCAAYYFVDELTTEQATAKDPECREYLSVFDDRSRLYNKDLYALNIPGAWRTFKGHALLIWGESDFVSSREDHQIIADAINHYGHGEAGFVTLPAATHGMQYAEDFRQALLSPGDYNAGLNRIVIDWLRKNS